MSNLTSQTSPAVAIADAHAAAVGVLSATGRDLFEAAEMVDFIDLVDSAAAAAESIPGSDEARAELSRRAIDGRTQLAGTRYISAARAHDIALDCWGPLEALAGLLN